MTERTFLVENEKSILGQRVKAVSHDGSSVAAVSGTAGVKEFAAASPTDSAAKVWYIRSQETGETATLSFTSGNSTANTLTAVNNALDALSAGMLVVITILRQPRLIPVRLHLLVLLPWEISRFSLIQR